jgi:hypothetical protein
MAIATGLATVVGVWLYLRHTSLPAEPQLAAQLPGSPFTEERAVAASREPPGQTQTPLPPGAKAPAPPSLALTPSAARAQPPAPPRPEPSPYTRSLVANLARLDLSSGTITPEQAQAWKGEYVSAAS